MANKIKHKLSKIMYSPKKKNENMEFILKRLNEVEININKTISAIFNKKKSAK